MNEDLKARLLSAMDKTTEWVEASEEFVLEQAPLICQEIVRFGMVSSIVTILIALLLPILTWKIGGHLSKRVAKVLDDEDVMEIGTIMTTVATVIFTIISTVILFVGPPQDAGSPITTLIKTTTAPRLYILEQLGRLF